MTPANWKIVSSSRHQDLSHRPSARRGISPQWNRWGSASIGLVWFVRMAADGWQQSVNNWLGGVWRNGGRPSTDIRNESTALEMEWVDSISYLIQAVPNPRNELMRRRPFNPTFIRPQSGMQLEISRISRKIEIDGFVISLLNFWGPSSHFGSWISRNHLHTLARNRAPGDCHFHISDTSRRWFETFNDNWPTASNSIILAFLSQVAG